MAESGSNRKLHLTQAELDDEAKFQQPAAPRARRGGVHHGGRFWSAILIIVAVVVVGAIILHPRKTPCHEQIIVEPTAGSHATLERCAPAGQRGGVFYGAP